MFLFPTFSSLGWNIVYITMYVKKPIVTVSASRHAMYCTCHKVLAFNRYEVLPLIL